MTNIHKIKIPLLSLLLLGLLALFGCVGDDKTSVGPEDGIPQLTIEDSPFDFGFVPQYAYVSHTFWLKSTGTWILKILQVSPG